MTSPNAYNVSGVGTTQLYNKRVVYNHKRHGEFKLGNRMFTFLVKPYFPAKATEEFLLVDLVNNLEALAEDSSDVLKNIAAKVPTMDAKKLKRSVENYGNVKAKKIYAVLLNPESMQHVA